MFQGADTHFCVEAENTSQHTGDGGIPDGDQYSHCEQEDDLSIPLINLKRTGGRNISGSKKKATVIKKNDLVSTDIPEGRKSASFEVDEGRTPFATKGKELLVYRRSRFRGPKSNGDGCNPTSNLNASLVMEKIEGPRIDDLTPARVAEVAEMPASTQVNGTLRKKCKQLDLNRASHSARKEYMNLRRKRQKALIASRRSGSGLAIPLQLMMPLQGLASPLPMALPFVQENVQLGDAWSEEELDALWIGVRRHGEGNWESIIRDPKLKFSSHKKPENLSERWTVEKDKALGRIQEPLTQPEHQSTRGVHPQAAKLAKGTLIRRSSHRKDNSAAGSSKRPAIKLGGVFPLSNAIIREFNGKEEVSSEGTISD